jgi:hypothetical protein
MPFGVIRREGDRKVVVAARVKGEGMVAVAAAAEGGGSE